MIEVKLAAKYTIRAGSILFKHVERVFNSTRSEATTPLLKINGVEILKWKSKLSRLVERMTKQMASTSRGRANNVAQFDRIRLGEVISSLKLLFVDIQRSTSFTASSRLTMTPDKAIDFIPRHRRMNWTTRKTSRQISNVIATPMSP